MNKNRGISNERADWLRGKWFRCVFCRQECSSYEILLSHESTCEKREAKRAEWTHLRMRHLGRQRRGREWNDQTEFRP